MIWSCGHDGPSRSLMSFAKDVTARATAAGTSGAITSQYAADVLARRYACTGTFGRPPHGEINPLSPAAWTATIHCHTNAAPKKSGNIKLYLAGLTAAIQINDWRMPIRPCLLRGLR